MAASTAALAAVRAAKNLPKWGAFAATRYAMNHGALRMFDMATRFERRRRVRAALRAHFAGYLA